jgi:hypothetical protein
LSVPIVFKTLATSSFVTSFFLSSNQNIENIINTKYIYIYINTSLIYSFALTIIIIHTF